MPLPFFVYMLACVDGSFYVGQTDDIERRLAQHELGEGAKYTKTRRPLRLAWSAEFDSRDDAKHAEAQIKRWTRAKKAALAAEDSHALRLLASRRKRPPSN